MAHHWADDGILAFSLNPGGIRTELQRHGGAFVQWLSNLMLYPTPMGAITQLYAGTSPKLTKADTGKYFIPWAREEIPAAGTQDIALADKLWAYLEKETAGKY
jgi:retinol dehydrogenase 12